MRDLLVKNKRLLVILWVVDPISSFGFISKMTTMFLSHINNSIYHGSIDKKLSKYYM